MQDKIENNIIMSKFDADEDVLSGLNILVDKYKIRAGFIDMGANSLTVLILCYACHPQEHGTRK